MTASRTRPRRCSVLGGMTLKGQKRSSLHRLYAVNRIELNRSAVKETG